MFRDTVRNMPYRRRYQGAPALDVYNSNRAARLFQGMIALAMILPLGIPRAVAAIFA